MTEKSLVACSIDLDAPGFRTGHLAVPQSTNSAGWANCWIPICVAGDGEGPTTVLFGGNHGDEYEGPVTLMKLAQRLRDVPVAGRLILVPMLNQPAVLAGTRLSPIDGVNMNRAFPGSPTDSITGMIAHFVASELIPRADVVIDIHSGGSSMHMLPSVNMHDLPAGAQMDKMLEAGREWGAPYVFIYRDVAGGGLLPSYAESQGKVTLGTEMGSKAQFGPNILNVTYSGVQRVLRWAGHVTEAPEAAANKVSLVAADDVRDYIMAPRSGIYEPLIELGDEVNADQVIGRMYDPELPFNPPHDVVAQSDGFLFARRSIPLSRQGECLAVIVRNRS
jgi:predicted deacylase